MNQELLARIHTGQSVFAAEGGEPDDVEAFQCIIDDLKLLQEAGHILGFTTESKGFVVGVGYLPNSVRVLSNH